MAFLNLAPKYFPVTMLYSRPLLEFFGESMINFFFNIQKFVLIILVELTPGWSLVFKQKQLS